jgi:hypothetical protein
MHGTTLKRGVAAVIVSVALAGCGSSSKSSSSSSTSAATATTASITKAEFLAKGNAICAAGNRQRVGVGKALGNNPSRSQVVNFVEKGFVPGIQSTIDQLRALGAPAGDQAKVTSMLDLAQADLNKVKANPVELLGGPGAFHGFAIQAHAYGLTQCAKNA